MARHRMTIMLFITIVMAAFMFTACAKKVAVKQEAVEEKPAAVEQPVAPAPAPSDADRQKAQEDDELARQRAREKALAEEELARQREMERERAARERAAAEAARIAKEASEFEDIHFDFDKYDLRDGDRAILDRHAAWLKAQSGYIVTIEGNCDERGTAEYNLALGQRRADSAMKYLVDLGVDEARIKTISYGEERPIDPGHNEEAWAKNRCDHFNVTLKK